MQSRRCQRHESEIFLLLRHSTASEQADIIAIRRCLTQRRTKLRQFSQDLIVLRGVNFMICGSLDLDFIGF
jgi:hypothetical protein